MTKDEALDLALEVLENSKEIFTTLQEIGIRLGRSAKELRVGEVLIHDSAITAIKQTRSAPVQSAVRGEPVFWYRPVGEDGGYEGPLYNGVIEKVLKECGAWKPLYTTPPVQEPVASKPDWQTIETAPKGYTTVLVWNGQHVGEARYIPEEDVDEFGWWWANTGPGNYGESRIDRQPTHWMPMPAAPIEAAHGITKGQP